MKLRFRPWYILIWPVVAAFGMANNYRDGLLTEVPYFGIAINFVLPIGIYFLLRRREKIKAAKSLA